MVVLTFLQHLLVCKLLISLALSLSIYPYPIKLSISYQTIHILSNYRYISVDQKISNHSYFLLCLFLIAQKYIHITMEYIFYLLLIYILLAHIYTHIHTHILYIIYPVSPCKIISVL